MINLDVSGLMSSLVLRKESPRVVVLEAVWLVHGTLHSASF